MRWIGKLFSGFRYFLDINVIWGLMIVVSFVVAVYDNYTPTVTEIPASLIKEGANKISIAVTDKDNKEVVTDFTVTAKAAQLQLTDKETTVVGDRPYLVASVGGAGITKLTWDAKGYGPFLLAVNGVQVARGRLATLAAITDAAFDYAEKAFKLGIGLVSTMVLFLGLMKVGEEAGIVQLAARIFRPVIAFLFPDVPKDHPANGAILMNITTSVLGLANAATPFAIKAMQELQKLNPHKKIASDSMVMFLGWNTAGLALLSTTLIGIRKSAGCTRPLEIIGPCIVAGLTSTIVAICMTKLLGKLKVFRVETAVAEEEREEALEAARKAQAEGKEKEKELVG